MSSGERIARADVVGLAGVLRRWLLPAYEIAGVAAGAACEDVIVAGSFRREEETVGDLELVLLPHWDAAIRQTELFGKTQLDMYSGYVHLTRILHHLINDGYLVPDPACQGDRQKRYRIGYGEFNGLKIELYIADPENFGYIATLRTGGEDWSHAMVTRWDHGGLLPRELYLYDGYVRYCGPGSKPKEIVPVRTEEVFFRAFKTEWVPPVERTKLTAELVRRGVYHRRNEHDGSGRELVGAGGHRQPTHAR